jgi:hypothetical protein
MCWILVYAELSVLSNVACWICHVLNIGICWTISFVKCRMLTCMSHADILCSLIFHILKCCVHWFFTSWNFVFADVSYAEMLCFLICHKLSFLMLCCNMLITYPKLQVVFWDSWARTLFDSPLLVWLSKALFSKIQIKPTVDWNNKAYFHIPIYNLWSIESATLNNELWRKVLYLIKWTAIFLNSKEKLVVICDDKTYSWIPKYSLESIETLKTTFV